MDERVKVAMVSDRLSDNHQTDNEIRLSISAGYFPSWCFVYAGISTYTLSFLWQDDPQERTRGNLGCAGD
jgi:hypothetical protein